MEKNKFQNQIINATICVSDLVASDIKVAQNGKKYLNITLGARKEVDQYGHNVTVYLSQTKEQKEAKQEKKYIGNAKHIVFDNHTNMENLPSASEAEFAETPF